MDAFAWGVVGTVATVAGVIAAIVFGIIPLMQGRRKAQLPPTKDSPHAEVPGGQGVQVGSGNEQINQYIQTYIENQHLPVVAGTANPQIVGLFRIMVARRRTLQGMPGPGRLPPGPAVGRIRPGSVQRVMT